MRRVLAWLRFRGWRNVYWREDWYMATCPHDGEPYEDEAGALCVDCGASLSGPSWRSEWTGTNWRIAYTGSDNLVTYHDIRLP